MLGNYSWGLEHVSRTIRDWMTAWFNGLFGTINSRTLSLLLFVFTGTVSYANLSRTVSDMWVDQWPQTPPLLTRRREREGDWERMMTIREQYCDYLWHCNAMFCLFAVVWSSSWMAIVSCFHYPHQCHKLPPLVAPPDVYSWRTFLYLYDIIVVHAWDMWSLLFWSNLKCYLLF